MQRAFLYFGFDYAVQRFDRIGYFLLVSGISQFLDFNSSGHGFAQTRIGWIRFVLHAFKDVRVRRDDFVYPASSDNSARHVYLKWRRFIGAVKNCSGVCVKRRTLKALAAASALQQP